MCGALLTNRSLLLKQLELQSLEPVRRLRQQLLAEASWFSSSSGDPTWDFVQECLLLLLTLARHLSEELQRFERSSASAAPSQPEKVPPLSPDVLSVSQQKQLASALQFVVSLGLWPYLAPGLGPPLGLRSAFGATLKKLCCRSSEETWRRLFTSTSVLLKLLELPSLSTLLLTQHLRDVMAALCQLGHHPQAEKVAPPPLTGVDLGGGQDQGLS